MAKNSNTEKVTNFSEMKVAKPAFKMIKMGIKIIKINGKMKINFVPTFDFFDRQKCR